MRLGSALIAAAAGAAAMSCGLSQEGIPPPSDRIFYPGAILVDQGAKRLYVVNSNADLRFNDGTLAVMDLDAALKVHRDALPSDSGVPLRPREVCSEIGFINQLSDAPDYCCWDALDHNVLDCDERAYAMGDSASVKIGSFGSAMEFLPHDSSYPAVDDGIGRLFVAVRGNASITWIKVVGQDDSGPVTLDCGGSGFAECTADHRVTVTTGPAGPAADTVTSSVEVALPDEPYALGLDEYQRLLYVGHLRGGFLSAVNLLLKTPELIGTYPGIFPGDINGSTGVTSLTVLKANPGIETGRILATSRFVPRAGAFAPVVRGTAACDDTKTPRCDPSVYNPQVFLANAGDAFVSPLAGAETRGIQVIPGVNRAFVLQRTPPALIGFDTTDPNNNIATDVLEMCSGPTFLHMHSLTGEDASDQQLFVTCFESGEIYVVDPYVPRVVAIIEVGRGPAGLAFAKGVPDLGYVVGFGSNNVSVIDLAVNSSTRYHVIQRIGFPNPTPR
jgi:hypothetical protein